MDRETIIEQIKSTVDKVEDETVLKDTLNLIDAIYQHHLNGQWGR